MSSPAAPFTDAMEAALLASDALALAMGGNAVVLREVPTNQPTPYVVIGQDEVDQTLDGDDDCGPTHSIVATVTWWASKKGSVLGSSLARQIGAAVIDVLRGGFEIEGHALVLAVMETPERYSTDPDRSTKGLCAYRYETAAQGS